MKTRLLIKSCLYSVIVVIILIAVSFKRILAAPTILDKLIHVVLLTAIFAALVYYNYRSLVFQAAFSAYVEKYQLNAEKLAAITAFSKYDFNETKTGLLRFGNSRQKARQQLLADLEKKFGKLE